MPNDSLKGHLKIFFGYAPRSGKTLAMLKEAVVAQSRGVDVAVGYINTHGSHQAEKLAAKLDQIPQLDGEFDTDAALKRKPQLIILDELAHTNVQGSRHINRYQDAQELLRAGIDVYTTLNVQQIESLADTVGTIVGNFESQRVPDSVFDYADQVEFIDKKPGELIEYLKGSKYTQKKLTALREIALRRYADRVKLLTADSGYNTTDEHILVCLSSSPSNARIIRTAARMASSLQASFTALFVETPDFSTMSDRDKDRLRANIRLAQQLGAVIETVCGDDVPYQIAEFARLSGVSSIIIGQSAAKRKWLLGKPTLTEQLITYAPNLDVHIIPDGENDSESYYRQNFHNKKKKLFSIVDILISVCILAAASIIGFGFNKLGFADVNIITVYILGVLVTAIVTSKRIYSLISSVVSVIVFNFLFTDPKFTLFAYDEGYPLTFIVTFTVAFLSSSLAQRLKRQAELSAKAAYRTSVMLETNRLLQQAADRESVIKVTVNQIIKLLNKDVVFYAADGEALGKPELFLAKGEEHFLEINDSYEKETAKWVYQNNKRAGATTQTMPNTKGLYFAVRTDDRVYGVIGIAVGQTPFDSFQNSILLSILGECALALENEIVIKEKEDAAVLAKNEQLRADLLRTISHDLRTPLTSILGNADNLITNGDSFDSSTKMRFYKDLYDDSMWLIGLVENLLSVTRLENGKMKLNMSAELVDEVISEALRHINRQKSEHCIKVQNEDEFLLAHMDARLIVQVIVNLVDNAVKYTPKGSVILITSKRQDNLAVISVSDNGSGIPDDLKERVFDMFYTGANEIADSRRSLGLGLSLCRSIVNAHGGSITVCDNIPHGTIFTFTLPAEEVHLNE